MTKYDSIAADIINLLCVEVTVFLYYDSTIHIIYKNIGETPLEAIGRFRAIHPELINERMTYAGRLDPMASGKLIILTGEECKNKGKYLNLDKVYEVEILFGISTDSYDVLGIPCISNSITSNIDHIDWNKYIGKFEQEYPPYSSKTVNGKQLHELARSDSLPDDMPTKNVEIYDIKELSNFDLSASDLLDNYVSKIRLVKGDFRQKEILDKWNDLLNNSNRVFKVIKIQVKCSSGTYMRSLANRVGNDMGISAFALGITRTEIITI